VEAGDYHNPMLVHLEEYSVGEAPDSRTPPSPIHDRELQRVLRDCVNCCFDFQREPVPKLRAYIVIPCSRASQLRFRLR